MGSLNLTIHLIIPEILIRIFDAFFVQWVVGRMIDLSSFVPPFARYQRNIGYCVELQCDNMIINTNGYIFA